MAIWNFVKGVIMTESNYPDALLAVEAAPNKTRSVYPEPFASMMDRREKRRLADMFGLSNFGVNLTQLYS
jgi:uncharacterized cupin superfamily protein